MYVFRRLIVDIGGVIITDIEIGLRYKVNELLDENYKLKKDIEILNDMNSIETMFKNKELISNINEQKAIIHRLKYLLDKPVNFDKIKESLDDLNDKQLKELLDLIEGILI